MPDVLRRVPAMHNLEDRDDGGINGPAAELLQAARLKMEDFDRVDGGEHRGLPIDMQLRTIIQALVFGLTRKNWDGVAEGLAMLQDAGLAVRQAIYKPSVDSSRPTY